MAHRLTALQKHSLTHDPARKDCKTCQLAKLRKYPARTKEEKRKAKEVNEIGHVDTIGPATPPTVHRERFFLFSMDDRSELIKMSLEGMKEADERS